MWTERVSDDGTTSWPAPGVPTPSIEDRLARVELSGSLGCIGCGYDLKGLSIVGSCPECGTAIRATILYRVDPAADEFRPLIMPRVVAWGVRFWAFAALCAAASIWSARLFELAEGQRSSARSWGTLVAEIPLWAISVSGLCALLMVRPIRGMRGWKTGRALVGVVLGYAVMLTAYVFILSIDEGKIAPYSLRGPDPAAERAIARLAFSAGTLLAIFGIRPVARELVTRSLALRTKRVDRQTLLAMAFAVGFLMLGDGLWLWGVAAQGTLGTILVISSTVVIAVASVLFTLGVVGATQDAFRIARALERPPPGLRSVLRDPPPPSPPNPAAQAG